MKPGGTVLSTEINDLQMQSIPVFLREQTFEVPFGLIDVFRRTESPARRQAVDVGIDRERRHIKGLCHNYRRCFMSDTR